MSVEGLLNLDKPAGLTSHDVVGRIRRISGIRRVGHAGTLDPLATGVLLVAVGRATRLLEYLVGQSKQYQATIRLGQTTDTYDREGDVIAEQPVKLTQDQILAALDQFRGPIRQVPPMYSAIKKNGQPLYKLARQGIETERPPREVTIHSLTLLNWHTPELELDIHCSSGTYIRSIAHDLGRLLGCGGHLSELRRTAVSRFSVTDAAQLDTLDKTNWQERLLPASTAVAHLPRLQLPDEEVRRLCHGQTVPRRSEQPDEPLVQLYDPSDHFIGVLTSRDDSWQARKIISPPAGFQ